MMERREFSKKVLTARPRTSKSDQSSLYFWFIKVLVVLGLIAVVIWLSLQPNPPVFEARVLYTTSPVQNTTLNAIGRNNSVVYSLTVSNPNKRIGIYYGDINVTIYHVNVGVGSKSVPGFYQGHEESNSFDVAVGDAVEQRGEVKFGLRTEVRYKVLRSVSKSRGLSVQGNVTRDEGSDGRMVSGGRQGVELHLATNHLRKLLFIHL